MPQFCLMHGSRTFHEGSTPGAESSDRYFRCVCVCVCVGGGLSVHGVYTCSRDFPGERGGSPFHLSLHYLPMFPV